MNEVSATTAIDGEIWRAAVVRDFAGSALFDRTFQQGMELVEQTAAYLDGPGRQESKHLDRKAALGYASESMRLTTRLMQVASWLLVQRAVREGEMEALAACDMRYRLDRESPTGAGDETVSLLPRGLTDLSSRSEQLYERVKHLESRMYIDGPQTPEPHPVLSQQERLAAEFGG
jgi:regulator of CtrA degradation